MCALRGLTEPFEAAEGVEGVEKDMEGIYGKFFRLGDSAVAVWGLCTIRSRYTFSDHG